MRPVEPTKTETNFDGILYETGILKNRGDNLHASGLEILIRIERARSAIEAVALAAGFDFTAESRPVVKAFAARRPERRR